MRAITPKPVYQFPATLSVPGHVIVSGPTWTRPSRSRADQGLEHTVSIDPATGLYVCTCESNRYRHIDCPHIQSVQQGKAGRPRYVLMPEPKPTPIRPAWDDADLWGDGGAAITRSLAAQRQAVAS